MFDATGYDIVTIAGDTPGTERFARPRWICSENIGHQVV